MIGIVSADPTIGIAKNGKKPVIYLQVRFSERDVRTAQYLTQPGDLRIPMQGDCVYCCYDGSILVATAGSADTSETLDPGGCAMYSRNPELQAKVRLDPDGTITISNLVGKTKFAPNGTITINNVMAKINLAPTGTITIGNELGNIKVLSTGMIAVGNASGNLKSSLTDLGTAFSTFCTTCLGSDSGTPPSVNDPILKGAIKTLQAAITAFNSTVVTYLGSL